MQKNEVKINESGLEFSNKKKENEIDLQVIEECSNNICLKKNLEKDDNDNKMKIGNKKNFILHKQ